MSYKLPSSADLLKPKANKGDKVAKDKETTLVPSTQEFNKRRRFETCEGDEFVVHVPPESCVFTSPASIEAHIEAIPSQNEKEHLKTEGLKNVTDDMVSSSYMALTYVFQRLSEEVKSKKKEISYLKVEKDKVSEEPRSLCAKLEIAKKSLEAEREKSAALHDQLDGIANKAMAKGRGELAIQYKVGLSSSWDFEEAIVEINGGIANSGHTDGETENAPTK